MPLFPRPGWVPGLVHYQTDTSLRRLLDAVTTREGVSYADRSRWLCRVIERWLAEEEEGWWEWLVPGDIPPLRQHRDECMLDLPCHAMITHLCVDSPFVDPWSEVGFGRLVRAAAQHAAAVGPVLPALRW